MLPELELLQNISEEIEEKRKQELLKKEAEELQKELKYAKVIYETILPHRMLKAAKNKEYEVKVNCGNSKYSKEIAEEIEKLVKAENKGWNTCVFKLREKISSKFGGSELTQDEEDNFWYFRIYWHWKGYRQI